MKKVWSIICFLGLPWLVIFSGGGIYLQCWYNNNFSRRPPPVTGIEDFKTVLMFSILGWVWIIIRNLQFVGSEEIGLFTWMKKYKYQPPLVSSEKRKAQYPKIPNELLSNAPDGLVLGRYGKQFVRAKLQRGNILNALILGSAGTGKSVLLCTMLLYQFHHKPKPKEKFDPITFFAIDCKPELANKSFKIRNNTKACVMNPLDRSSCGWDVYYRLNADSTDDEVFSELDLISRALIDSGKADKNEFFYQSGRNICTGILFYTYKQGRSFMQGLDYLLGGDLATVVKKTLEKVSDKPEYQMVYTLLAPYADKTGEAFQGIELAVREAMAIFVRQNVKYFFDGNPRKSSPLDLEKKKSIFFSIHENHLEEYGTIIKLIVMQVMDCTKERPEDSHLIVLLLDEIARIACSSGGSQLDIIAYLATSRAHQVCTICAAQSFSQLVKAWGKEDAKSLMELCRIIEILSVSDPEMAHIMSEWVGVCKCEKHSINNGGKSDGSSSTSFEDEKILTQADLMDLQDKKEAVAFYKGKYLRFDIEKARYYMIPELRKISEECVTANNNCG